jgi:hypothetical protein
MWNNNVQVKVNNRRNDAFDIFWEFNKNLINLSKADRSGNTATTTFGVKKGTY